MSVRRLANPVLFVLIAADVGAAVWVVAWLVRTTRAPGDPAPLTSDALLGLLTAAVAATFVVALVLAIATMVVLVRPGTRRSTWFVLAVLATLIGLPDVVLVMLTATALALPRTLVLSLLAPALTLVAVITAASFSLARPNRP